MEINQAKRIFVSAAAGSALAFSTGIVLAEHWIHFEPDRPQVSPACLPNWGFHQTCWKRFGPLMPCDPCETHLAAYADPQSVHQELYVPQQGLYSPQHSSLNSQPLSILPDDPASSSGHDSQPAAGPYSIMPMPIQTVPELPVRSAPVYSAPVFSPPIQSAPVPDRYQSPVNPTPVPQAPTELPPLPSPMEQSRYGRPGVLPPHLTQALPLSAVGDSRYRHAISNSASPQSVPQLASQPHSQAHLASQPASPAHQAQSLAGHQGLSWPPSPRSDVSSIPAAGSSLSSVGAAMSAGSSRYGSGSVDPFRAASYEAPQQYTTMPSGLIVPSASAMSQNSATNAPPMPSQVPTPFPSQFPSQFSASAMSVPGPGGSQPQPQSRLQPQQMNYGGFSQSRYGQAAPQSMPEIKPALRPAANQMQPAPASPPLVLPVLRVPPLRHTP